MKSEKYIHVFSPDVFSFLFRLCLIKYALKQYWIFESLVFRALLSLMPTLADYPEVSRIQNESPGLPYSSPNLPNKSEFGYLFSTKDEKSSELFLQINLRFLVKDGRIIVVRFYSILVYVHPF